MPPKSSFERLTDSNVSVSAQPPVVADIVVLGKIVGAYGLNGAVRVHPFADDPAAWAKLKHWWIGREGESAPAWGQHRVSRCRMHGDSVIAQFEGMNDRTAAESLHGLLVGVPRLDLPATEKDEYYWADLVGLDVVNTKDQPLGRVLGLIETSANDVLRVGDGEGQERLLPFVGAVVLEVDLPARRMRVEWEADW